MKGLFVLTHYSTNSESSFFTALEPHPQLVDPLLDVAHSRLAAISEMESKLILKDAELFPEDAHITAFLVHGITFLSYLV
jgi:hypothetical protein